MNNKTIFLLTLLSLFFLILTVSCRNFWGEIPNSDPLTVYDGFWDYLDRDYAGFMTKTDTDWVSVRAAGRTVLEEDPTEIRLQQVLNDILNLFDDGHMFIRNGSDILCCSDYNRDVSPFSINTVISHYLTNYTVTGNCSNVVYGEINSRTAYLYVSSFSGGTGLEPAAWTDCFQTAFNALSGHEYLIIDLRDNHGGASANGNRLLGHFIDQEEKLGTIYFKMGSGNTFSDYDSMVTPSCSGKKNFRLVVLINKKCYSTADMVTAGFQAFTDAFIIGNANRAELVGDPRYRELPNGWIFNVPTSNIILLDGTIEDGDILPVDSEVDNSVNRLDSGHDDQLEAAIDWIAAQPN